MADNSEQQSGDGGRPVIAIIGAGSIGSSFAVVFATAGFDVRLQDSSSAQLAVARSTIADRLAELRKHSLVVEPVATVEARITFAVDLATAVSGANHVQECVPESIGLKRALFVELDRHAGADATLASSSSFLPASSFAGELAGRHRVLVIHPGNPPYLLRIAELVPAPFTSPAVVERASRLVLAVGLQPIVLARETEGFVFNRLQGAVLREAYRLVGEGVTSAADIDRLMRDGLGLRWSLLGPFETAHLNTRGGIAAHAERMGPSYLRMGREHGDNDPWPAATVASVAADLEQRLPLADWEAAVAWRDHTLMALLAARRAVAAPISAPVGDPALGD